MVWAATRSFPAPSGGSVAGVEDDDGFPGVSTGSEPALHRAGVGEVADGGEDRFDLVHDVGEVVDGVDAFEVGEVVAESDAVDVHGVGEGAGGELDRHGGQRVDHVGRVSGDVEGAGVFEVQQELARRGGGRR